MIFVQIASYRDPELLPTIIDCLAKAKYPRELRFGICWQRCEGDNSLSPLSNHKSFRILDVPWQQSRGLCWARSEIQRLYNGEEFTMQLDSHHRFEEHWDAKLVEYMGLTGSSKPILGSYAGVYDPRKAERGNSDPYAMVATGFSSHGTIPFVPKTIPNWQDLTRPVRARFVSGHFFFTLGKHCEEYRYDPILYFAGDEISLSIRSFTCGYDLFHPHRTLVWHEYTRKGRIKHWDDHTTVNKELVGAAWHERDLISKRRLRKLLREEENEEDLEGFDLGTERSHRDYELYAGIDFARRRLQQDTLYGLEPPCVFVDDQQWEEGFSSRRSFELKWDPSDIEECNDLQFLYVGLEDQNGKVIYRYDAPRDSDEARMKICRRNVELDLPNCVRPASLVIWPYSTSMGWMRKKVYNIHQA